MSEDTDQLFDPTMKKKKKKKVPINLDDLDTPEPAAPIEQPKVEENLDIEKRKTEKSVITEDLDVDDFSSSKKKKKKKRGQALFEIDSLGEALPSVGSDVQTDDAAAKQIAEDELREYTYDELLKRVFDIMRAKNPNMIEGGKRKFVMKPPQVVRVGTKKTSFVNFTDICKILHRQPKHLLAFLLAELGTSGTVDGTNQLIIKGRFQQKHIENVLRRYIKEYVTCHTCRSPDTILHKETRLFFLQCETCGSRCSVQSIKSGFQAVTTKRAQLKNKQQ
ncbi:eukaryotic translation initiation factor 2 subunit 2 isoform X2 [Hydra vulgaris]|uniref:eukaryotic translation initiation factor 2 subunit 2 isoform X2 n=1 Tax=Hydra vulgaris TaxID=6087 RepID=UPI001F5F789C|nr:eukaryotic translation initiation factor 2 subunit 2 isoform X2 [Hydra vulgaris]